MAHVVIRSDAVHLGAGAGALFVSDPVFQTPESPSPTPSQSQAPDAVPAPATVSDAPAPVNQTSSAPGQIIVRKAADGTLTISGPGIGGKSGVLGSIHIDPRVVSDAKSGVGEIVGTAVLSLFAGISLIVLMRHVAPALARWLDRRHRLPSPGAQFLSGGSMTDISQQLESIALEVERIGENQRFLTQALSRPGQGPLHHGAPSLPPTAP